MTTEEHLQKIVAKCRANLELAARRTPGKWDKRKSYFDRDQLSKYASYEVFPHTKGLKKPEDCGEWTSLADCENYEPKNLANAAFIAACAGSAEAGWRATIAAIEGINAMQNMIQEADPSSHQERILRIEICLQRDAIIAAWPEELL